MKDEEQERNYGRGNKEIENKKKLQYEEEVII